jgi:AcrR family transcriptional regulator
MFNSLQKEAVMARRGRPPEYDRDRVLDAAMRLFWAKGYEATSIADLAQATGLHPPSLYGAFGCKEALFRAVVRRYGDGPAGAIGAALAEPTAEAAIARALREAVLAATSETGPHGCLCSLTTADPGAEAVVAEQRRATEAALRARIERGISEGDVAAGADAATLAGFVAAILRGLAAQARDGVGRDALLARVELAMRAWPEPQAGPPARRGPKQAATPRGGIAA